MFKQLQLWYTTQHNLVAHERLTNASHAPVCLLFACKAMWLPKRNLREGGNAHIKTQQSNFPQLEASPVCNIRLRRAQRAAVIKVRVADAHKYSNCLLAGFMIVFYAKLTYKIKTHTHKYRQQ